MTGHVTLCIAGKNQIAIDVLDCAVRLGRWRVVALPNARDDGSDGWQPSFRRAAADRSVPVVDLGWAERMPGIRFLSAEYDRLIRPDCFTSARLFNIHFSLLPHYRGCNTAIWPILNGEREHGVTLHWIDRGMDTGPIIDRRRFAIGGMTARQLYFRCMEEGGALVREWLDRLVEGDVPAVPQDVARGSTYRRSDLNFKRKAIDPHATVETVLRSVRAFYFPEYQRATFAGRPIDGAVPIDDPAAGAPGTCVDLGPWRARLSVADGAVELTFADQPN